MAIVQGAADGNTPLDQHAAPLAAALPHARLVVLPAVGHWVQFEQPAAVLDAIAWVWQQAEEDVR